MLLIFRGLQLILEGGLAVFEVGRPALGNINLLWCQTVEIVPTYQILIVVQQGFTLFQEYGPIRGVNLHTGSLERFQEINCSRDG